jgi:hypothetical protein
MPLDADVNAVHSRPTDLDTNLPGLFAPPVRARSAARASPRLFGIASAACFGAPLGSPACVPHLPAPPRCWCACLGHLLLTGGTHSVSQTSA